MGEGAPAHGSVAHLLPQTYKRHILEWLEEDTPSFDYGGFVVGEEISEAKLLGKSEVIRKILLGERVALNTLARCSGIATKSDRLLVLLRKAGYPNILAGTRKTTPGFRLVEKYGMLVGGVDAHRVDLSAMTMLKDNHIVAAGSITNAVRAAKSAGGFAIKVEVECQSFEEADEAIAAGADIVMLDNFTPDGVKVAAAQLKGKWGRGTGDRKAFLVEVSGGLTEHNVEKYVCEDIDIVSTSTFQVSVDRLLELYFENFWPSFPIVLPFHYFQARRLHEKHGMDELLLVLQWIGCIYAPWTVSEPYYKTALQALSSVSLARTPFNVQALMLFAIAQYHCDVRGEARLRLDQAVSLALELCMNQTGFAQAYGEANPVLEESWRRTYYMITIANQYFAIVTNSPIYTLLTVPNFVDLPCDDDLYESGQIPQIATWAEYENREFEEIEIIYSSLVYLYDMTQIAANIMKMFIETGTFGESLIDSCDAKFAIWLSLLPACKRDPLQRNGKMDEVMFTAHMIAAIILSVVHRPFSSLAYSAEEMLAEAFSSPNPFVVPPKSGRSAHTARTLKAVGMQTKLLAIPCVVEKHSILTMCITAQLAAVQVSACTHLLEDFPLSIARDRVRLSIGFLNAMGSIWPLGKRMAKEVRAIARSNLTSVQRPLTMGARTAPEIDLARDDLIWPIDPSIQIDIYSGIVLPTSWDATNFAYSSSHSSNLT
ncbi:uncharacterized protein K460DRAFT_387804 [Cucurbitaria berberidis CBS 394.84]|uniref:Nicotinate-nucleotide pyrophosphorylase [carboxylating] n=1 Tax=Cucurbitaria berberidis CBS 394.84 TaxID=1168544 RepID=A0A9P4L776_9PLEO|nr:uncharacterized protein K460DRAFT_387804 [Cucurbitaria berberidis CBS 394.84]KAF1843848.1 hypothetical protein K460DRAFT_387804 [Cucurbitaria berberidis CBS 394.84]